MAMDIRMVIFTIGYLIVSNFILVQFANLGIGITCTNLPDFSMNNTIDYVNQTDTNLADIRANVFDVALGRCEGLPMWAYWIFEIPFLIGLAYIIRGFIGAT